MADRRVITDDEARFFLDNGYLILRGVLRGEEFRQLRAAMDALTEYGAAEVRDDPDYAYGPGHKTGAPVLKRIEYVIDKTDEGKVLLGNPFILRSVEKLMGPDLIPTWDSMVLKLPGEGIEVPWHRDAGAEQVGDHPIFNVDFYLDAADEDTCVWIIPGSHKWPMEQVEPVLRRRPFTTEGAIPALLQPGDVLFHDILVLHGSPPNNSDKLRRVVYYEFRTAHVENDIGPHVSEYIPLKQQVLRNCIERRKACPYIPADEEPFEYRPPEPWNAPVAGAGELATYRYPHSQYWRNC
jgi:phytanoyl-CoA hydroxylase